MHHRILKPYRHSLKDMGLLNANLGHSTFLTASSKRASKPIKQISTLPLYVIQGIVNLATKTKSNDHH